MCKEYRNCLFCLNFLRSTFGQLDVYYLKCFLVGRLSVVHFAQVRAYVLIQFHIFVATLSFRRPFCPGMLPGTKDPTGKLLI